MKYNLLIIPGNDTILKSFQPFIELLPTSSYDIAVLNNSQENAEYLIGLHNLKFLGRIIHKNNFFKTYDFILIGNDWGDEIKSVIFRCKNMNIPTVLIQESSVKFGDSYKRYSYADILLLQGETTLNHVQGFNNEKFIVGNPRFCEYNYSQRSLNDPKITININFTYGIHEDGRETWLLDIINTLNSKYSLSILKHPRDISDLSSLDIKIISSNAEYIYEKLKETDILITRFSSLIHEALLIGIPVIFYNKFNEGKDYDFIPDNKVLFEIKDISNIKKVINEIQEVKYSEEDFANYLNNHFLLPNSEAPKRILNFFLKYEKKTINISLRKKVSNSMKMKYLLFSSNLKRFIKSII